MGDTRLKTLDARQVRERMRSLTTEFEQATHVVLGSGEQVQALAGFPETMPSR
ncbi:hypothetical protein APY03_1660 [Variovorax sp. WDL1]|nr:hypothetical protein APY03_1660 [Variovorax sp. WDL1]